MTENKDYSSESSGPATDKAGNPVVDPTANVLALVAAEARRQDDLRKAQEQLRDEQINHVEAIIALRASFDNELRVSEANRIDAIRAVDTGAVSRAAEVAAAQATTLATQVAVSAETLRGQVSAAAQASNVALAAALEPVQRDIQDLRKVQYEQAGAKQGSSDIRTSNIDQRSLIFAILGVLATAAIIISPHIH